MAAFHASDPRIARLFSRHPSNCQTITPCLEVLSQAEAGEQVRARFGLTDAGLSPERFAKRGFAFVNWRCNLAARSMVLFVTSVIRNIYLDLFGYHHFITSCNRHLPSSRPAFRRRQQTWDEPPLHEHPFDVYPSSPQQPHVGFWNKEGILTIRCNNKSANARC